ncbi:MAG: hypothetical protein RLZZ338_3201 [Cyanobacteriota bacterium]|jgi:hypothetical protein
MVQELVDLRISIFEGRYEEALGIIDELEGMSKQAILRNIESFLIRLMIHLIKNQVESRLSNSGAAAIALFFNRRCTQMYAVGTRHCRVPTPTKETGFFHIY